MMEKSVEVEVVDNGYLIRWRDLSEPEELLGGFGYPKVKRKTRGVEIILDKKKLLKRLGELL